MSCHRRQRPIPSPPGNNQKNDRPERTPKSPLQTVAGSPAPLPIYARYVKSAPHPGRMWSRFHVQTQAWEWFFFIYYYLSLFLNNYSHSSPYEGYSWSNKGQAFYYRLHRPESVESVIKKFRMAVTCKNTSQKCISKACGRLTKPSRKIETKKRRVERLLPSSEALVLICSLELLRFFLARLGYQAHIATLVCDICMLS